MRFQRQNTYWDDQKSLAINLNNEFDLIDNNLNNYNDGIYIWDHVNALAATITSITVAGNIAMAGFKLTGLGAGTTNGDSVRYEQVIGVFLPLAGGTMAGVIAMGSNKITGLAAGTTNGDALRYEQLIGLYLLLTGGTMSGNIAMGTNKVTGLGAASSNGDALRYEQLFGGDLTLIGNLIFNPTTKGVKGTTTNDNTSAGNVGEFVSASDLTDPAFPATGTYGDLASISLTAGDWDVSIVGRANQNGATWTLVEIGISTTSGNSGTGLNTGDNDIAESWASSSTTPTRSSLAIPAYRMSVSSTTIVYYKIKANYSAGGPVISGRISARRVR